MVLIKKETKRSLIIAGVVMIATLIIILAIVHEWFLWLIFVLTIFGTFVAAIWPAEDAPAPRNSLEEALADGNNSRINDLVGPFSQDAVRIHYRALFAASPDFVGDLAKILEVKPKEYLNGALTKEINLGFVNGTLIPAYIQSFVSDDPALRNARCYITDTLCESYVFYYRKRLVEKLRKLVAIELDKTADAEARNSALRDGLEQFVIGLDIRRYWIYEVVFEETVPAYREITRQYVMQNEYDEFDELGAATGAEAKKPIGNCSYRASRNFRSLSRREYEGLLKSGLALSANQD